MAEPVYGPVFNEAVGSGDEMRLKRNKTIQEQIESEMTHFGRAMVA